MHPHLAALVDGQQFDIPTIFPAEVHVLSIIVDVTKPHEKRQSPVLIITIPGGVQLLFAIGQRELKRTKYGRLVIGFEVQPIAGSRDVLNTNNAVAIKVSDIRTIVQRITSRESRENPIHEIAAMELLGRDNPHIMSHIAASTVHNDLFVIMRYVQSEELFDYLQIHLNGQPFPVEQARQYFRQLMVAVAHMHSLQMAHLDISLENILAHVDPITRHIRGIILLDFGLVHRLRLGSSGVTFPTAQYGKQYYAPPEVITHFNNPLYQMDPRAFDIWACGIVLYILLTGAPLFDLASPSNSAFQIMMRDPVNGLYTLLQPIGFPPVILDLLQHMLRLDPTERLPAEGVLLHAWFNGL